MIEHATKRLLPRDRGLVGLARFHSLLVPLDLSPSGDRALGRLTLLPPAADARVTLLHVVPGSLPRGEQFRLNATRELGRFLATVLAKMNVSAGDSPFWRTYVQYGSPRLVVEKAIRNAGTDLLMLGTRGYSGAAYVLLGTVAGDLLRAAKCDVLVVPPAPSG